MTVLIVDDSQTILKDLSEALLEYQCVVRTASSVTTAKEEILHNKFDYAIIDLKLDFTSKYGGLEVYKFAKQNQPELKSIILSAFSFQSVKEQLENSNQSTLESDEIEVILNEIASDYVYKGEERNYIDAILEKLEIEDTNLPWYGDFFALLIAVQDYEHHSINDLKYPISDANKLKGILTTYYNFEDNRIIELQNPTRQKILIELDNLSKELTANDNLLIFYAGHGYWHKNREQGYWFPADARSDSPDNWISNGDVRDFIRGIKTQHTLLISDACFGGAILKTRNVQNISMTIQEKYRKPSRRAITSSDATHIVPDRSLFLDYLLTHLETNLDQYLYAEKLFTNVCDEFVHSNLSDQNPIYGRIQHTGDEVGGDFIFIRR